MAESVAARSGQSAEVIWQNPHSRALGTLRAGVGFRHEHKPPPPRGHEGIPSTGAAKGL